MHVLGRVLNVPQPQVGVLGAVERAALEAAPPHREDERVGALEDPLVPAVLLEAAQREGELLLAWLGLGSGLG